MAKYPIRTISYSIPKEIQMHSITSSPSGRTAKIASPTFFLIWFGQLISLVGSGMTSFALSLWVYQQSGSITQFALINVFAILPHLLLSPLAGAIIDRRSRRMILILSDSVAACSSIFLGVLFFSGQAAVWHILLAVCINAAANTFQWPAFMASMSLLVPPDQLGKANGMLQFNRAAAEIFSPMLAGMLISRIDIFGILIIDLATFLVAVSTLTISRIPQPTRVAAEKTLQGSTFWQDCLSGFRFILKRHGLCWLVGFTAIANFFWGLVAALLAPMILEFAAPDQVGLILSIAGGGLLCGSLLMSSWGGSTPKIKGALLFEALSALGFILIGARPWVWSIAAGAFCAHFTIAIVQGSLMAIWQAQVPTEAQGRVFAAQQMITRSMTPLALICAGPLVDGVIKPLLGSTPVLSQVSSAWLGAGDGQKMALIFLGMAAAKLLLVIAGALNPQLRKVEEARVAGSIAGLI
jgi:MFS transporter, DHA3 family, macrolide efflux protein